MVHENVSNNISFFETIFLLFTIINNIHTLLLISLKLLSTTSTQDLVLVALLCIGKMLK